MESFSCLWVAGTPTTCPNEPPWLSEEFPEELCHSPPVDLSKATSAQREGINKFIGNACDSHRTKATIVSHLVPLQA